MTDVRRLNLLGALALAGVLAGCAAPPPAKPVELRQAAPDASLFYFFRPSTDVVDMRDSPTLEVDGKAIATLGPASYAEVALTPGKHRVALIAGPSDSKEWNQAADMEANAGLTYYVALWHQRQPKTAPSFVAAYGAVGALMFQMLNPPSGEHGVRFEQVSQDIAEFSMAGLKAVPVAGASKMQ